MLEQMLYQPRAVQQTSDRVYQLVDLSGLGALTLYSSGILPGPIGSAGSGFSSGPAPFSIQRPVFDSGVLQERFRAGSHEDYGNDHLNLEYTIPGIKHPLVNIHIPMNDD